MRSYYLKVLGLGENATLSDIKSAYRKLARLYHPDVSKLPNANAKFIAVNEAYKYLISPQKTKPRPQVWQQPPANTRKPKPKSEVEMRREKMRETFTRKRKIEKAEIEALRKMTLQQYMQSAYFRNTRKNLIHMFFSGVGIFSLVVYGIILKVIFESEAYFVGIIVFFIPFVFVWYVLFTRPK